MYKIKSVYAKELEHITEGKLYGENCIVQYISTDTREEYPFNTCFIALKGKKFNGNDYVKNARANLIITDEILDFEANYILVKDTKFAFCEIAKALSNKAKVIGITGSVGKTTVKDMTYLILKRKFNVKSTLKNENNEIGVAKTLLSIGENDDYCVVEMGMRRIGEIRWLSYLTNPEISAITNCGTAHLELLGSEENIFKAKTEIIPFTKKYCLVPDEKRFSDYKYDRAVPIFIGGKTVNFFDICYNEKGIRFSVVYEKEIIENIELSTFNINNAKNALFAISIGKLCGVPNNEIRSALKEYKGENMREEITQIKGITVIKDCYNASYESMKGAIFSLVKYAEINRLVPNLLLGDMLEIGENANEYHYRIGELAKDLGIKRLYAKGKYAKNIMDGFLGGIICSDNEEAAKNILNELNTNDTILVKASRAIELEKIIEKMKELSNE